MLENIDPTLVLALAAVVGYLFGSIPWGLVLTRMSGMGDIRNIGSGNIGATNVLRTGNKFLAFLTLVLDTSKGAVAAYIFREIGGFEPMLIAGFCAVVGHNFPIWLGFKGGKGVATSLGTILIVSWPVGVLAGAVWLLAAGTFRYSSLASILALASGPFIAMWFTNETKVAYLAAGLAAIGLFRHKDNIKRLIKGQETKIGQSKSDTKTES